MARRRKRTTTPAQTEKTIVDLGYVPGTLDDPAYAASRVAFFTYHERMQAKYKRKPPGLWYQANRNWGTFIQIGNICASHGWDAEDYVRTVMDSIPVGSAKMTPRRIANGEGIYMLATKSRSTPTDLLLDYESYTRQLLSLSADSGITEERALLSAMTPFPPWYRVVFADPLTTKILDSWSAAARTQVTTDTELLLFLLKVAGPRIQWLQDNMWGKIVKVI